MNAKINPSGRYVEGMRNRQKALTFIVKNPGAHGPEIAAHMGGDKAANANRLTRMTDDGDVSRELTHFSYRNEAGALCNVSTYAYTALRTKVLPTVEVKAEKVKRNLGTHRAQALNAMKTMEPWLTRNVDPDRKAKRNPDAQHSGMPRVFVGSVMG